ncbi:TOTE conflict system archaeo-eukaryotic primase domain-containing protein [Falsibacillus pallidus]|uniref:Superfamily II DNA or RNA helicase n=1 Tax=Falsibacillus pallidus TaxID=493781 RepID=A0A370G8A4_9BACI|nr:DEAD/DEAH box helicase [Falsibacillus pallidus]RDI40032.1 hypothetical protein DFR59_11356 [Falsibacillus pallidus]
MSDIRLQLDLAYKEIAQLRAENQLLKRILEKHNISYHEELRPNKTPNNSQDSAQKKRLEKQKIINHRIRLYMSLFKGREDVYAERWESKKGTSGYSPACKNEWVPEICQKPNIKCSECLNKQYLPFTEKVVYKHLNGEKTIGIYPLIQGDQCNFLAVDFDKGTWKQDVEAFRKTCRSLKLPAYIEKSRSGNGAHVWIFFEESVRASLARKLGTFLLEKTSTSYFGLGIDSYDRLFPNQDKIPVGGVGNLIAMPLQGNSRKQGNSVFVDENFEPYPNQWTFLETIERMKVSRIIELIGDKAPTIQTVLPVSKNNKLPKKLTAYLYQGVHFKKNDLSPQIAQKLFEIGTFNNPQFFKAQSKRLSTHNIPRKINCIQESGDELILPRGCLDDVSKLFEELSIQFEIQEKRHAATSLELEFKGKLYPQQVDSIHALKEFPAGTLSATTGFGKTVIGAAMINERKENTLVIVHRNQLIQQWRERLASFLSIDNKEIGELGGGKNKLSGKIDIATIQSLSSKQENLELIRSYGHVIVDECHHISAFTFEKVMKEATAKYVLGLTATPTRKDGLHPIMTMQCGPIRYKVNPKKQAKIHSFSHVLVPRKTNFLTNNVEEKSIQAIFDELCIHEKRNDLIFNDVLHALEEGRNPIILTERQKHVEILEKMFKGFAKNIIVLIGGLSKKEERERLLKLKEVPLDEERIIIATGKYIGEGFDDPRLDTLFLTMPVSWSGTLQQYVGRLHRSYMNKETVEVYDYIDEKVPVLQRMYEKRKAGYKALGYKTQKEPQNQVEQMKLF